MATTEVANEPLSQFERVLDLFIAPSQTFRDILRSTSWWLPYVLLALSSLCVSISIEHKVGWEQVVQTQLEQSSAQQAQITSLDPAQRATRLHAMAVAYRYTAYAYPAFVLLLSIGAALVLWCSFTFGLGSRATFSQMLCLWMYASLPRVLTSLIVVVTLWFGDSPDAFDLRHPAGTNLGYYFTGAAAWLRTLLGFFDVIGLWSLVLLIIGGAIVARVKKGHAAAVVISWWLILVIVSVGLTAAFA